MPAVRISPIAFFVASTLWSMSPAPNAAVASRPRHMPLFRECATSWSRSVRQELLSACRLTEAEAAHSLQTDQFSLVEEQRPIRIPVVRPCSHSPQALLIAASQLKRPSRPFGG